jgi:hypothetical protein
MASPALNQFEVEGFDASVFSGANIGARAAALEGESPDFIKRRGALYLKPGVGVRGAKGALTALGLEAAAAFCLYGVWQLWHLLR